MQPLQSLPRGFGGVGRLGMVNGVSGCQGAMVTGAAVLGQSPFAPVYP